MLGKRGGVKIQSRRIESINHLHEPQKINNNEKNENENAPPHHNTEHAKCEEVRLSGKLNFKFSGYRGLFTSYSNVIGLEEVGFQWREKYPQNWIFIRIITYREERKN